MNSLLVVYVISALSYMLHVGGISLLDTPLPPGEEQLSNGNIATFSQKGLFGSHGFESIVPNGKNKQDEEEILDRAGEAEPHLDMMKFNGKNMIDAHTRLFSNSESDARNALKTIRSQLFHQIRIDRNWRRGNSMAIMNLKALELLLVRLDVIERTNNALNPLERNLLENSMETIYDLSNFSRYPDSERVWLHQKIDEFFRRSNSLFLRQEYLQTVRRRIENMDYKISFIEVMGRSTPAIRIDETQVTSRNTPPDILDFINVFNEVTTDQSIPGLQKTLDRWSQTLETPTSIKQPPKANQLRLELIGVGALSFGLQHKNTLRKEWHFPFFTTLLRLMKSAWDPGHRILAEKLVRSAQVLQPTLTNQFVREYPMILKEKIDKDLRIGGVNSLFDGILSNGVENNLRQTASEFKSIFEKMQEIHLNEIKLSLRNDDVKLEQSSFPSLSWMRNHPIPQAFQTPGEKLVTEIQDGRIPSHSATMFKTPGKEIVQEKVDNYSKLTQYLHSQFLNNPLATRASRLVAEELLFGAGLVATKLMKFKFPGAYESLYRSSLAALRNVGKERISYTIQNHQADIFGKLANKYSSLMEENATQVTKQIQ